MRTYTEKQIKEWFELMKVKYPNSNFYEHLESVEMEMFHDFYSENNLKNILKNEN